MDEQNEAQHQGRCRFNAMVLAMLIGASGVVALLACGAFRAYQTVSAIVCALVSMLMAVQ